MRWQFFHSKRQRELVEDRINGARVSRKKYKKILDCIAKTVYIFN